MASFGLPGEQEYSISSHSEMLCRLEESKRLFERKELSTRRTRQDGDGPTSLFTLSLAVAPSLTSTLPSSLQFDSYETRDSSARKSPAKAATFLDKDSQHSACGREGSLEHLKLGQWHSAIAAASTHRLSVEL